MSEVGQDREKCNKVHTVQGDEIDNIALSSCTLTSERVIFPRKQLRKGGGGWWLVLVCSDYHFYDLVNIMKHRYLNIDMFYHTSHTPDRRCR